MADSNIAGLPAGAAVVDTDLIAGSDAGSGTLVKKTGLQLNTYVQNKLSNLPTTDPNILGMLWNNGGLVAISQPFTRALAGATGAYALSGHTATLVATTWIGPTWSLTDIGFAVVVSGTNNETIARSGVGGGFWTGGRSDAGLVTGLRYVEFHVITNYPGNAASLGFANGAASLDSQEVSNNAFYFKANGQAFFGGGFAGISGQLPVYTSGDVVGIEIDLDLNTVRGRTNGGAWTSTENITAMRGGVSAPIYVYCELNNDGSGNFDKVTLGNV